MKTVPNFKDRLDTLIAKAEAEVDAAVVKFRRDAAALMAEYDNKKEN